MHRKHEAEAAEEAVVVREALRRSELSHDNRTVRVGRHEGAKDGVAVGDASRAARRAVLAAHLVSVRFG